MTWLVQYPESGDLKRQAEKALSLHIGLTSPFWLAFGAAASAGLTWWWAHRLSAAATNLEALLAPGKTAGKRVAAPTPVAAPAAPLIEAAPLSIVEEPVVEAAIIEQPIVEAFAVEAAPAAPDDLTRLVGIGPKVAAALAARGVTRFAELAAWTEHDMAKFDADLKLLGRGTRDAWIAQAKRLAAEA